MLNKQLNSIMVTMRRPCHAPQLTLSYVKRCITI